MRIVKLSLDSLDFPSPKSALREPNGLVAIGGDLNPQRILRAYERGIFPWFNADQSILWWSPDPRAVIFPRQLHIGRTLKRFLRHNAYRFTLNHAFEQVIAECAEYRDDGTWISRDIQRAYIELHHAGHAHSVEVWDGETLIGGLYGVSQGALFCGESMFSRRDNASKSALAAFCEHFLANGGELIDCQVLNAHTAMLGAQEVSRRVYLHQLSQLQHRQLKPGCWKQQTLTPQWSFPLLETD